MKNIFILSRSFQLMLGLLFLTSFVSAQFTSSPEAQTNAGISNLKASGSDIQWIATESGTTALPQLRSSVLYTQLGDIAGGGNASQQFPDFSNNTIESADDFVVPVGQVWTIQTINTNGTWSNPSAGAWTSLIVRIFSDPVESGSAPGALVYEDLSPVGVTATNNPNISLNLSTPAVLSSGRYWVSVVVVMNFGGGNPGQWFWSTRTTVESPCRMRDTANLLGLGLTNWSLFATAPNQGLSFSLIGTSGITGNLSLRPDFCNTTLQTVDQQFFARRIPGYNVYVFEITNMSTNEMVTVNRGDSRGFRLTLHAPSIVSYNTVYQVRVKASNSSEELPFGGVCTITTPSIQPPIKLRQNNCGITLNTINQVVYSEITPLANEYTFEVKNIDTNSTEEFVSNTWFFNLSQLVQPVSYGDAFEVRVKSKVNDVSNDYGDICTIVMPTSMVANLTSLYCNQNFNSHRTLYANKINQAQEYTFEVTNSNDETIEVVRSVNFFHILYHTSTDFYGNGGSFDIRVKVKVNNTYGDYDQTCNVFFGEPALLNSLNHTNVDKIEVYPNPFTNEFTVRLATVDFVTVQLFDINGRLIENRQVQDAFEITMGQELNAGIYLVRVEQNGEVQSFKMIKK